MAGKLRDLKPAMAMVLLQVVYAGLSLLSRLAFLEGLNVRIYIVYRQTVATLVLAPVAYALKRRKGGSIKCGLTWKSFCWINLAALVGVTLNQNTYFEGLYLSSASTATATTNLIPCVTFVIAACLGLEKVNFKSMRSNGKIVGTLMCISGAMAIAFLRGSVLLNTSLKSESWVFGCLLLFASACCWSLWLITQVPLTKCHPDHLSAATWICLFAMLQSIVIALVAERDLSVWIVKPNMELVACIYSGVLASGLAFFLQAWCISIKGPLYSAMFNPLCTVIATVISCVFLSEKLYVGSLVGAIAVIIGLYIVLWAKAGDSELGSTSSKVDLTGRVQPSDIDLEDPLLIPTYGYTNNGNTEKLMASAPPPLILQIAQNSSNQAQMYVGGVIVSATSAFVITPLPPIFVFDLENEGRRCCPHHRCTCSNCSLKQAVGLHLHIHLTTSIFTLPTYRFRRGSS